MTLEIFKTTTKQTVSKTDNTMLEYDENGIPIGLVLSPEQNVVGFGAGFNPAEKENFRQINGYSLINSRRMTC